MKKLLSIFLAILMLASVCVITGVVSAEENDLILQSTADEATKDEATKDEATEDEPAIFPDEPQPAGTYRYYFYLPDEWINDYAYTAGIYWWEGSISGEYWPGNAAKSAGVDGVFYYDVAVDTPTIIWNNYLDGGMDSSEDIYTSALQSVDIIVSDGSFDGMIYVINLDEEYINSYNGKVTYGGEWYYYYGSGMYGTAPTKAEAEEIFTDKSFGEWATPDEAPTEPVVPTPPATEPTEATDPSEAPTEPVITEPTAPTDPSTTATDDETDPSDATDPTNPETGILGDVNGDGKVNVKDATLVQKNAAKLEPLTVAQEFLADVNADGKVNVKDATAIQKYAAKIETGLPIGELV